MKIINNDKLLVIIRNYFLFFGLIYIISIFATITSQERVEQFSHLMPPELMGLEIFSISATLLLILFVVFSVIISLHVYKILNSEYLRVYKGFIEGPTHKGERQVVSLFQIKSMGRDLFGQFSIFSDEFTLVLPGKLSISQERKLQRLVKSALKD